MIASGTRFVPDIWTGEDENSFSKIAADFFIAKLETMKSPLVALPTGNTPLGLYRALITHHGHRRDLWDQMRFVALDEYIGLQQNDPRLFYDWLRREFLDPAGIPESSRIIFQSNAADPETEVARMAQWVRQNGPIDLAVLGLGANGHIAFNEPGCRFNQPAHIVTLTPESIAANAGYWGSAAHVPKTAMTLGLGELSAARNTLLLVNGAHKANILRRILQDAVTTDLPATYLRTIPHVTIITDRDAFPPDLPKPASP